MNDDARFVTRGELDVALGQVTNHADAEFEKVHASVEGLVELVEDLTATDGGRGKWRWSTLHGPARRGLWDELRGFVDWYNERFGYTGERQVVPPCWPLHPIAVEELTAQLVAWKAAHAQEEPTDWLRTWCEHLYPAIDRLHDDTIGGGFSRCTTRAHRVENLVDPVPVSDDDFEAWVQADLTACPPPLPEDDTCPR